MAHWKEHCKDCEEMLGDRWEVVHHWLDEYAKTYWPSMVHRVHRHHREGVHEIREKWGDEAAEAAEIHIIKDEGAVLSKDEIEKRYNIKWQTKEELEEQVKKCTLFGPDKIDNKGSTFLTDFSENNSGLC